MPERSLISKEINPITTVCKRIVFGLFQKPPSGFVFVVVLFTQATQKMPFLPSAIVSEWYLCDLFEKMNSAVIRS
jgi:hypothetical protein